MGISVEELNNRILSLEKEKSQEEEYRNYMQLERVSAPPRPAPSPGGGRPPRRRAARPGRVPLPPGTPS